MRALVSLFSYDRIGFENVTGDTLQFIRLDRRQMGTFLCIGTYPLPWLWHNSWVQTSLSRHKVLITFVIGFGERKIWIAYLSSPSWLILPPLATNDVPPAVSKRITLDVNCKCNCTFFSLFSIKPLKSEPSWAFFSSPLTTYVNCNLSFVTYLCGREGTESFHYYFWWYRDIIGIGMRDFSIRLRLYSSSR